MSPLSALLCAALAQSPERVSFVFGGDVIPHDPIKAVARTHLKDASTAQSAGGWLHVFGPLSDVFRRNDFAVVNLETPVTTSRQPERGELTFNATPEFLTGMRQAGITVATFANNHCLDQGPQGITETRRYLDAAGLLSAGADATLERAWQPLRLTKRGLSVCVVAVSRYTNQHENPKAVTAPHVPVVEYSNGHLLNGVPLAFALEKVKDAAARCDAVVVAIHWGDEYETAPRDEDRRLALRLLNAGALAVIGHHPHVLQPVEELTRADGTRGLVAYSMGNLLSNQDAADEAGLSRDGLLLELEVVRDAPGAPVHLGKVNAVPMYTENHGRSDGRRDVQPRLVDAELEAMGQRLTTLLGREDDAAREERAGLERRLQVAKERRARIMSFVAEPWRGELKLPATAPPELSRREP